jgi:hypothetical protein
MRCSARNPLSHGRQFPDSSQPALSMGTLVVKGGMVTAGSLKKPEKRVNW